MTNLILYFKNSSGIRREIGRGETEQDIFKIIHQFLENHNFKSYYTRTWISSTDINEKVYDVGSHTEFFICYNPDGWSENNVV